MNAVLQHPAPLIEVSDLQVRFGQGVPVLKGISFTVQQGECLALVGESGSGKSVTSRTLAGLTGAHAQLQASRLAFAGQDLRQFDERAWRRVRGAQIGFVMQDALGSLDPLRPVGKEIAEPLQLHSALNREQRQARVLELLRAVGVPEPELRARQYPWQLSGGLRQRALIASAIACNPRLLIADEPTTALDATVQAQVLSLLESLRGDSTAMLIVSHDLAVVSRLANRVAVMHNGVIVEQGSVEAVLQDPQHPYTQYLLKAGAAVHFRRPQAAKLAAVAPPVVETSAPLLQVQQLSKAFKGPDGALRTVVDKVSLQLHKGRTLGIVGESGSGKTTLTRMILGLETPDSGAIQIKGRPWLQLDDQEKRALRRSIQVVFQDPLSSFDPRYTVQRVLYEALQVAGHLRAQWRPQAVELLTLVRLDESLLERRPIELSGGQRQRIAIARALAAQPQILVCDEPVSALDVSVQAQILELLDDLKQRLGLACLFISHDLGVINHVSDQVLVMKDGVAVESGAVRDVFDRPQHPYTRALLDAIPHLESGRKVSFEFLRLAI
ncbi:dipeptide ABC transporter ATP-binding protein [Pseudomonas sp. NPDC087612]|uniref:dipeptide ABC transporter ATP-binding protein n=1 Tax=unclassified Pseudomonas TaxID=196821 RepID=UPI0005EAE763|nr:MULTISPECIES: ABC transporter ATP-binding protein [unclassified Pseudomonas]KJK18973.1 ABC transporter ATP-binding protein [Pseudomonas sp. 2(2015)]UVM54019.1 ABC transporter ATP-binding protein [Pseudomonas sp. B21-012]SDQ59436.1 peptide/nickel transport system ATP-binding protein [Pseudomonas sp. UC 17F4]